MNDTVTVIRYGTKIIPIIANNDRIPYGYETSNIAQPDMIIPTLKNRSDITSIKQ